MHVKKSKEELQAEKEIIEWMKSFGTLYRFRSEHGTLYSGIRTKFYHLFDASFTDRKKNNVLQNKKEIIRIAKGGEKKPSKKTKLGCSLFTYTWKKSEIFDRDFYNELKKLRPDWFENYLEKLKREGFARMIKLMPSYVKFKEGQEWGGLEQKHTFICERFGEFQSTPGKLMSLAWKKNNSGHPKNAGFRNSKKIKNLDTGEIFNSATEASIFINQTLTALSAAIRRKGKCGGYYWAYVE